jgi:2-polyprenyl-3-methyl-5-hydroxy-6-metoxy-1,4-benzoquinol methylase
MKYPLDISMKRLGFEQGYWELRKDKRLYTLMPVLVRALAPDAKSAIDVGCFVGQVICDLDWIPRRLAVDTNDYSKHWAGVEGVEFRRANAFTLKSREKFDLVISNQTIEHVDDPAGFAAKLCDLCTENGVVICSTTYKVAAGVIPGHVQDPIDEEKFLSWFPRKPKTVSITYEVGGLDHIVGVF